MLTLLYTSSDKRLSLLFDECTIVIGQLVLETNKSVGRLQKLVFNNLSMLLRSWQDATFKWQRLSRETLGETSRISTSVVIQRMKTNRSIVPYIKIYR